MPISAFWPALRLYAALLAQMALFVCTTWALSVAVGGRVTEVRLGFPRVLRLKAGGGEVRLGLLPLGASVSLLGRAPADPADGPGNWRGLSLVRRLIVLLGPWVATVAVAVLCLGPTRALGSMARALPQLLFVLDLTPLIRGFLGVLRGDPWPVTLGVVLAKLAAFNLLPLPTLAGGAALHEIWSMRRSPGGQEAPEAGGPWLAVSMLFLFFYMGGRLAWGWWHALF